MNNRCVSLITPCYNGEEHLHTFFNSILSQTYKNIELIFVNDGSTDNSEKIALGYANKLEEVGIVFKYLYQENQGQASAVNKALKIFSGEYFTWMDSDDFLMPDSIQKRIAFLEEHREYGFVRSDANIYYEYELDKPIKRMSRFDMKKSDECIFDRLILEQNMPAMNGIFMVRREALERAIPDKNIFCSLGGQNWQLELPIAYMYRCGFIDSPLFGCVIREKSHSRSYDATDINQVFERYDTLKTIIEKTIEKIPLDESKYKKLVEEKYIRLKFISAIFVREFELCKTYYLILKSDYRLRWSDRLKYLFRKKPKALRLISVINTGLFYLGIYDF